MRIVLQGQFRFIRTVHFLYRFQLQSVCLWNIFFVALTAPKYLQLKHCTPFMNTNTSPPPDRETAHNFRCCLGGSLRTTLQSEMSEQSALSDNMVHKSVCLNVKSRPQSLPVQQCHIVAVARAVHQLVLPLQKTERERKKRWGKFASYGHHTQIYMHWFTWPSKPVCSNILC